MFLFTITAWEVILDCFWTEKLVLDITVSLFLMHVDVEQTSFTASLPLFTLLFALTQKENHVPKYRERHRADDG